MSKALNPNHATRLPVLVLLAALAVASTAAGTASGGLPPAFGKLCGHVSGATWHYKGHTGTQYNVTGLPSSACAVGLKSVSALTRQTPHAGALGAQTLTGPSGFACAGLSTKPAHAGTCASGGKHFLWAPRLA